jgi:hypothetical protein
MNNHYLKVEGHNHLVRDVQSNAIINTNKEGYQSYKSLKNSKEREKCRIDNIENDLNSLKSDLDEIKSLLRAIANGS